MSNADRIRTAADDLRQALAGYDPASMRQLVRDLPVIGAALEQAGTGVRAIAAGAEQWPTATAVVDALYNMAGELTIAAQTANIVQAFGSHHEADIERHDAPRGGSRAAESRWDVGHTAEQGTGGGRHRAPEPTAATTPKRHTMSSNSAAGGRGNYNPDQPRAMDGKWTAVGDVLGYADDDICHGTDQVASRSAVPVTLALLDYNDGAGRFVQIGTPSSGRFNPLTDVEQEGPGDNSRAGHLYAAPMLAPAEAETAAGHLDELALLAEDGYQPPKPTRHTRAAQQIQHLIDVGQASLSDPIGVGDRDDFPLTVRDVLALLEEKNATDGSAKQARRKVTAKANADSGGNGGTVWMDVEAGPNGTPQVVVTAVEGDETPDDEFWRSYASPLTPAAARELAEKLRTFGRAARRKPART